MIRRTLGTSSRSRRRARRTLFLYVLSFTRERDVRRRSRREEGPSGPCPRPVQHTRPPAFATPGPEVGWTPHSAIRVLEREDA
jgi:hypothetical protein